MATLGEPHLIRSPKVKIVGPKLLAVETHDTSSLYFNTPSHAAPHPKDLL